jgi:hypothetical protein
MKTDEKYILVRERASQMGWSVIEKLEIGRKEVFYHTSKDVAELALQDLINEKFDPKKYPQITDSQPMIVKFEEKHGESFYVYTNREEFFKIFLEVLIYRFENGWYDYDIDKPKQEVKMSLEEINALTDEKLKKFQLDRFKQQERDMREYNEFMQLKKDTETAFKKKNARLAYFVLDERKDGEYEKFEIIKPQRVEI